MSETVERWKGKDRVSKELRLLEPKNTSFRRSVASGLFTGEPLLVKCATVEAGGVKAKDFQGKVAVRVLGLEVGSSAGGIANIIAISSFAVTDHSKYQSFLNTLRNRPDVLRTAISHCKESYEDNCAAQHVNNQENPFVYRAMRDDEDSKMLIKGGYGYQRCNKEYMV
ncbi:uncharacterized protein H6S33_008428 [Morchella sextelata]|uniref:uncharacterized protein n=1 Tax=Morchella sextelata TaxID=1174677 RepID=UPI001D054545|nr:uncharacterized protein H6S33_008428 [Morchella sextelata]KAH0602778.1 hypothetical protein H6S33_008428 [Morchella sextelata]